jgi:hypothetical protein
MTDYPAEVIAEIAEVLEWIEANPYGKWDDMQGLFAVYRGWRDIIRGDNLLDDAGTMQTVPGLSSFGRVVLLRHRCKPKAESGEQPAATTDLPDNYADFRDGPSGPLLTAKYCKERFNVSGKDLSLNSAAKKTRLKNPGGRAGGDFVYRYDVVSVIANRKSGDD